MKLDLRSQDVKLSNGIALRVRPLKAGEYHVLLGHVARVTGGGPLETLKLAVDRDAIDDILKIVEAVVTYFDPFQVDDDAGERDGVLADLWLGQTGLIALVTVLGQLLSGGKLPEVEAKN